MQSHVKQSKNTLHALWSRSTILFCMNLQCLRMFSDSGCMFLDSFCSTSSWQGWQSQTADVCRNAGVLHRLLPSIGGKQANLHVQGRPKTSHIIFKIVVLPGWDWSKAQHSKNVGSIQVHAWISRSICKRLCWGAFLVEKVEAHEHRSSLCWWQSTLLPEAQASAHHGAQFASLHRRGQLCSALDAQLLHLDSKQRTAIGLRGRKAQTHAEDVVEPEGVTKAGRPVKELLATPSITTRKLFVEANADWRSFGWGQRALVRDAQANADVGAKGVAHICHLAPAVEANVHSFSSKEWISNCTNANTLTEAIVQPPKLVEHLVTVQVGGDVRLCDVRHGACLKKLGPGTMNWEIWAAILPWKYVHLCMRSSLQSSRQSSTVENKLLIHSTFLQKQKETRPTAQKVILLQNALLMYVEPYRCKAMSSNPKLPSRTMVSIQYFDFAWIRNV